MGPLAQYDDPHLTGLSRSGLLHRAGPFLGLVVIGFMLFPFPPMGTRPGMLAVAGVVLCVLVGAVAMLPWERLPRWTQVVPMLTVVVIVGLLRDAEGGAVSAEGPIALVPVFWCALYGTRSQLAVVILGVAAIFALPVALIGAPRYPPAEWERVIVWPCTDTLIGLTVQALVARIRGQSLQLERLANTDGLTGLANRRAWDRALAQEMHRAVRTGQPLAVALLDLNHFKAFNDAHGHPAADRFLQEVASGWAAAVRPTDTLARLGGDEFGLILPGLDGVDARAVLDRLTALMPAGQSAAAGLTSTDGGEPSEVVIARADALLYQAKARRSAPAPVAA